LLELAELRESDAFANTHLMRTSACDALFELA
jgi:hypothetical protein